MTWNLSRTSWTVFLGALVLLTGCGKNNTPTPEPVTDNEQIVSTTPLQAAYLRCTDEGHTVQIQYDAKSLQGVVYCVFESGLECPALAFLSGECTEKLVEEQAAQEPEEEFVFDLDPETRPRFCEPIAEPVCGADGRTYVNECVAELQGVDIIYEGSCDGPQPTVPAGELPSVESVFRETVEDELDDRIPSERELQEDLQDRAKDLARESVDRALSPPQQSGATDPNWVAGLIALYSQEDSSSADSIQRCTHGRDLFYYQTGDFSVLYRENGSVLCYPRNDINGLCPEWFRAGAGECRTLWSK